MSLKVKSATRSGLDIPLSDVARGKYCAFWSGWEVTFQFCSNDYVLKVDRSVRGLIAVMVVVNDSGIEFILPNETLIEENEKIMAKKEIKKDVSMTFTNSEVCDALSNYYGIEVADVNYYDNEELEVTVTHNLSAKYETESEPDTRAWGRDNRD